MTDSQQILKPTREQCEQNKVLEVDTELQSQWNLHGQYVVENKNFNLGGGS